MTNKIQNSEIEEKGDIIYDIIYGVPHVIANNLEDLYFGFSYVVAKDHYGN